MNGPDFAEAQEWEEVGLEPPGWWEAIGGIDSQMRDWKESERRFLLKVEKTDECWLWRGAHTSEGYGRVLIGGGREHAAHREAWLLYCGPTDGLYVLHRCDTPACVNPAHLFLGTHRDNMADLAAKGRRQEKGIKYSAEEIQRARSLRDSGLSYEEVAERTGMSNSHAFSCVPVDKGVWHEADRNSTGQGQEGVQPRAEGQDEPGLPKQVR